MTATAAPIDPLAWAGTGRYEDGLVVVRRQGRGPHRRTRGSVRTVHFDVEPHDGRLLVTHRVPPDQVTDDLAGVIRDELFVPGWVVGSEMFERIFTGVVLTGGPPHADALENWELFYRNTIRRLAVGRGIEDYAPIYEHAIDLVASLGRGAEVLELGCCFGFLSLRLAALGHPVVACDVSAGTVRLLERVAPRLGLPVGTVVADAARLPLPDSSADVVLAVHLLEHLDADHGAQVVDEALRLARRRVVVAVPLEEEPEEAYGHVRSVTLDDLRDLGGSTGLRYDVHEHHGGWLVVDL